MTRTGSVAAIGLVMPPYEGDRQIGIVEPVPEPHSLPCSRHRSVGSVGHMVLGGSRDLSPLMGTASLFVT